MLIVKAKQFYLYGYLYVVIQNYCNINRQLYVKINKFASIDPLCYNKSKANTSHILGSGH